MNVENTKSTLTATTNCCGEENGAAKTEKSKSSHKTNSLINIEIGNIDLIGNDNTKVGDGKRTGELDLIGGRKLGEIVETLVGVIDQLVGMLKGLFDKLTGKPDLPAENKPVIKDQSASAPAPTTEAPKAEPPAVETPKAETPKAEPEKSQTPAKTSEQKKLPSEREFAGELKERLVPDKNGKVHEEQLQYGIIGFLLEQKFPKAEKSFEKSVNDALGKGKGYEDAVKSSLQKLVSEKKLTQKDADSIYSTSFRAAQLDSNQNALYDNKGGKNDKTIATEKFGQAAKLAYEYLKDAETGKAKPKARSLKAANESEKKESKPAAQKASSASKSSHSGGSGGISNEFLWKPTAEKDGKLVVLLPASLTGDVSSLALYSSLPPTPANRIEDGRYANVGNGDREHFRFSKAGSSYQDGLYVVATLKDGTKVQHQISETSARFSKT
jgi:hypothetical protein